jgi:hypothetical protein
MPQPNLESLTTKEIPALYDQTRHEVGSRMTGAGVGAYLAGPPGAAVGDLVAGSLFEQSRSGAVRLGISPTERIILSPKGAAASRSCSLNS